MAGSFEEATAQEEAEDEKKAEEVNCENQGAKMAPPASRGC